MKKFIYIYLVALLLFYSCFIGTANQISATDSKEHKFKLNISERSVLDNKIRESSGLILVDGQLWTHNDKGGKPEIYRIDSLSGKILQTIVIDNYQNIDWEEITADNEHIYIGDFGNNLGYRKDLRVLVLNRRQINSETIIHLKAEEIEFSYADQQEFKANTRNNFDCEAMVPIGDSLYLFTKDRGDNQTRVYALSKLIGNYSLRSHESFNVNGRICGASYNEESRTLALVGYEIGTTHSFMWLMRGVDSTNLFSGTNERFEIGGDIRHWKTEGISFVSTNKLLVSCETTESQKAAIFTVDIIDSIY